MESGFDTLTAFHPAACNLWKAAPIVATTTVKKNRQISIRKRLLFGLTVTLLFFGCLELALRLLGFEHGTQIETMRFTFPIDDYNDNSPEPFLERDPVLFWKPRPGVLEHNSMGCIGPEFSPDPKPGVYRIVCLGDSCTHFGPDPYASILQSLLDQEAAGRFEVINAGVIGYTSYQGLQLLKSRVVQWKPNLVTVYFGWNDHWLAMDNSDKDQKQSSPSLVSLRNALDKFRSVQLMSFARTVFAPPKRPGFRVEPSDYESNLMAMHKLSVEIGADLWYLTAPQALDLGIPPYLVTSGEVDDVGSLISLHEQYNSRVRNVAEQTKSVLVDLESELNRGDKASLFDDDHIHLSATGRQLVAAQLLANLHQHGILQSADKHENREGTE